MELLNYMYMAVIAAIIFTGAGYLLGDMTTNYPAIISGSGGLTANSTLAIRNFTEINSNLTDTISSSTTQALTFTQSDNPLTAAFGYLLGVFNGINTLIRIPAIMLNVIGAIMESMGIFIPAWLMASAILLIMIGTLISVFYFISKVK